MIKKSLPSVKRSQEYKNFAIKSHNLVTKSHENVNLCYKK